MMWLRKGLLFLLTVYRLCSVPFYAIGQSVGLPFRCKYPITCSEFAAQELRDEPDLLRALTRIVRRLLSCGPWAKPMPNTKTRSCS